MHSEGTPEELLRELRGHEPNFDREGVVYHLGDGFPFETAEIRYNFDGIGTDVEDTIDQFRGAPNLGHLYLDGEQVAPTDHRREEWERVMTERHCSPEPEQDALGDGSRVDEWKRFYERKDTTQAEKHENGRK